MVNIYSVNKVKKKMQHPKRLLTIGSVQECSETRSRTQKVSVSRSGSVNSLSEGLSAVLEAWQMSCLGVWVKDSLVEDVGPSGCKTGVPDSRVHMHQG